MITNWTGKRVTIMGLGRFGGGAGVTRWLARQGAVLTVTDKEPAERLAASLAELRDLDVRWRLGGHDEADFRNADLVVVNPAVPETSPFLQAARAAGVPVTTEINLFVERCPATTVGITGSVGKSTITAMTGHVLTHALPQRRVWVGGNIGRSLLDALPQIQAADVVVLELSSFQLERTPGVRWSPHVALITNVTPNHLDWHGSFEAYQAAKLNLVRFQQAGRDTVIHFHAPALAAVGRAAAGPVARIWSYGLDGDVPVTWTGGADVRWDALRLGVPGRHNRENAAAALSVAHALGVESAAARAALASFESLPHRLQRVGTQAGVTFYDDSKSTTPESALTALAAFDSPLLVILGGYDKGSDLAPLAHAVARRAKFAACIGKTGLRIAAEVAAAGGSAEFCGDLAAAVSACRARAAAGDTVLLSPACASWDQFEDYRQRGLKFAALATGADAGK